ncbi:MAG: nucleotidyl transferase AbiEii/AbiGii toxin family protein, partial [Microgenomates group bacterium]
MMTKDQLFSLAKKYKINEVTILREYIQLYFLSRLYSFKESQMIFFKGGTAIHFLYHSTRFSEDLDFTVEMKEKSFLNFILKFFNLLQQEEPMSFRKKKTVLGKKFLLTYKSDLVSFPVFINLDFSFREKIVHKTKSIISVDFPIIFRSYIYHPDKKELLAEKIRALLIRGAGRDIYDLWFLLSQKTEVDEELILKKLSYYKIK